MESVDDRRFKDTDTLLVPRLSYSEISGVGKGPLETGDGRLLRLANELVFPTFGIPDLPRVFSGRMRNS